MTLNKPTIEDILAPKPEARLRIYAWTPNDPPAAYVGLIKVGQTTQANVNDRIQQSQGQMQQAYKLHVDDVAERDDGTGFRDGDVRQRLIEKGFENVVIGASREWMRCSPDDVKAALLELQMGLRFDYTAARCSCSTVARRSRSTGAISACCRPRPSWAGRYR